MSAEPARAYLGIGEVIAQLRAEFPEVSVSKIRFLEAEGLIHPARSPSGYRKFAPDDVDRLRYILTVQRDQYLPLRVIRDNLEVAEGPPAPDADGGGGPARLSRRELLDAAGIGEAELRELEAFGLVSRVGGQYPPEALDVVRAVVALGSYGVQARHTRVLHANAERETALIEQLVAPILAQRSTGARERAGEAAREIASLTIQAHAALIKMALADAGLDERASARHGR